jgi:hypothetical protein
MNRFSSTSLAGLEQRLEDLIIDAMRQPLVQDLYLDFMNRWYKLGGGLMVLSNLVDKVDHCAAYVTHYCGYNSLLENLAQSPDSSPKYQAALLWLNGSNGTLPFTSADVVQPVQLSCSPNCVWGTCYNGTCVCFDGFAGSVCDQQVKKYLDCASNKTLFGTILYSYLVKIF